MIEKEHSKEKTLSKEKKQEILDKARRLFKTVSDADKENKDNFVKDIKFAFNIDSGHWDGGDIKERIEEKRPYLTSNKLAKFVAQVVNYEKGIPNKDEVIPVDDKADVVTAKVINAIITDIEYRSNAEEIYTLAGEHAAGGGFGFWRVITEYTDDGFDQEIKIIEVENPLLVYKDPRGRYAFVRECLSKEEFDDLYPDYDPVNFETDAGFDTWELWYENEKVWIAEFFIEEPYEKEIVEVLIPDSEETQVFEITEENKEEIKKFNILRSRKMKSHKIMWYKITGNDVLEYREWPGKYIPIVEVVGHQVFLEGKTYKMSLIKDAKDANRMYNYWLTALTEKVALTPKSPYHVNPQQISGHEEMWKNANRKNFPYLLHNGNTPPQRAEAPQIDNGALQMLQIANNDIKDILGMYETSVGEQGNERSGKAIIARNARSDQGTFTFPDNLRRAKVLTKKIMIDLIPKIYDNARILRLMGTNIVPINQPYLDDKAQTKILNNLSMGRYDIRVQISNSPSRRQQTAENITQAMQYAPDYAGVLLPVLFKFLDAPGAEEIVAAIQQKSQQIEGENNGAQ